MRYKNPRPALRRVITPAATAALVPALMLAGGTARAAWPSAHRPASLPRVISASLSSVSCKGNSFCMAAGTYRTQRARGLKLTEAWNGNRWHDVPDPLSGHLGNISCGSPRFCFAGRSDSRSRFLDLGAVWNGRTWKAFKEAFDAAGATCGSPKVCMTRNAGAPEIDVWNGQRWRSDPSTNACDGGPPGDTQCGYNGISCGSASTCMALWHACSTEDCADGPDEFFSTWDGTSWSGPTGLAPYDGDLSCSWGNFCMLTSWPNVQASIWDTLGWQDVSPDLPAICTSAQKCSLDGPLSCGAPQVRDPSRRLAGSADLERPRLEGGT